MAAGPVDDPDLGVVVVGVRLEHVGDVRPVGRDRRAPAVAVVPADRRERLRPRRRRRRRARAGSPVAIDGDGEPVRVDPHRAARLAQPAWWPARRVDGPQRGPVGVHDARSVGRPHGRGVLPVGHQRPPGGEAARVRDGRAAGRATTRRRCHGRGRTRRACRRATTTRSRGRSVAATASSRQCGGGGTSARGGMGIPPRARSRRSASGRGPRCRRGHPPSSNPSEQRADERPERREVVAAFLDEHGRQAERGEARARRRRSPRSSPRAGSPGRRRPRRRRATPRARRRRARRRPP